MAYKSHAQAIKIREMYRNGDIDDDVFAGWEADTDWERLPERVGPKRRKKKSRPRTRPRRGDLRRENAKRR